MRVVLLLLDEQSPLDGEIREALVRYLTAMLCAEVEVAEVPDLPIAPKGWRSLFERLKRDLKNRPGRPGSGVDRQLFAPQLLDLMRALRKEYPAAGVPSVEGASCVLGLTACELFFSGEGLLPDEPAPLERTRSFSTLSAKGGAGAVSIAPLGGRAAESGPERRKFVRHLLTLVSHAFLELLQLRSCQSQQCLAYMKPFSPETTSMNLCCNCEEALLRVAKPRGDAWVDQVMAAADRYRDLADTLHDLGSKLHPIKISRRGYVEFEEDCDWLHVAEEILRESAAERKSGLPSNAQGAVRRRSLLHCLRAAHEGQPHRTLKRTFTQPLLKRTCLMDMTQSAPYRHECGDLSKWTIAIMNRKHEAGGHYVELGGSLTQKRLGAFVDSGLNASMAPSGQRRMQRTLEQLPITWREQRPAARRAPDGSRSLHELPKIRSRTRALQI